jgi:hypothetical protein
MILIMLRVRSYRMKLEEWGIRKNKVAAGLGNKVHARRSSKTTSRNRPSLETRSSNMVSTLLADNNTPR